MASTFQAPPAFHPSRPPSNRHSFHTTDNAMFSRPSEPDLSASAACRDISCSATHPGGLPGGYSAAGPALDRRPSRSRLLADVEMAALEGKLALLESQRQLSAVKCKMFVDMMESTMESTMDMESNMGSAIESTLEGDSVFSRNNSGLGRPKVAGAKQHMACDRIRGVNTSGVTSRNSNSSSGAGTGGGGESSGDERGPAHGRVRGAGAAHYVDHRRRSVDVASISSASARCASWREDMVFYSPSGNPSRTLSRTLSRRRSGSFRPAASPAASPLAPDAAIVAAGTGTGVRAGAPAIKTLSTFDEAPQYSPRGGARRAALAAAAGRRSFQTIRELRYEEQYEQHLGAERAESGGIRWAPSQQRYEHTQRSQPSLLSQRSQRLSKRDLVSASDECDWLANPPLPSRASTEPLSNGSKRATSSSAFIVPSVFSSSNSIATTCPIFDSSLETCSSRSSSSPPPPPPPPPAPTLPPASTPPGSTPSGPSNGLRRRPLHLLLQNRFSLLTRVVSHLPLRPPPARHRPKMESAPRKERASRGEALGAGARNRNQWSGRRKRERRRGRRGAQRKRARHRRTGTGDD
ncbi:hypothetical protein CLOM_g24377 [Closterium sp. NIES-68]|nr:hypothetical protein CLOM_g23883 [Closterium sp. NIES-68]GJP40088.1 hypothetical protein CLOM_g24377 [Closterium sp. NIES-68]